MPLLAVNDYSKIFEIHHLGRQIPVFQHLTFDLMAGQFLLVSGPNGIGKSTLLRCLFRSYLPSSGQAIFDSSYGPIDLARASDIDILTLRNEEIGFVFQFYNLMPSLTARENVELVTEISDNPLDASEALKLVGLGHRQDHFPSEMSGGEQQRVAIARAVAKRPTVLFCDEPTGALDSETGRQVLRVIQDVNANLGTTVMIVTHAAATAAMAHRVINMADGAVREVIENETRLSAEEIEW